MSVTRKEGWINIYSSGYWHKPGKPAAYDRHAGDVYPTKEAAFSAIERPDLYVDTVPIAWIDKEDLKPNSP